MNLKSTFPYGSQEFYNLNPGLPHPKLKPDKAPALGAAVPGKEKVLERITVSYRLFRVRPLDNDNAAGSTKDCTDGLCRCGLIPGDDPWSIKTEVTQEQVATYAEERTEITVTYPHE